jgi:hypothetical protein
MDLQEAVNAVVTYINKFGNLLPTAEPRLEEFDFEPEADRWVITMSFDDPIAVNRTYKTFSVNAKGKVESMRIRNPLERMRV